MMNVTESSSYNTVVGRKSCVEKGCYQENLLVEPSYNRTVSYRPNTIKK